MNFRFAIVLVIATVLISSNGLADSYAENEIEVVLNEGELLVEDKWELSDNITTLSSNAVVTNNSLRDLRVYNPENNRSLNYSTNFSSFQKIGNYNLRVKFFSVDNVSDVVFRYRVDFPLKKKLPFMKNFVEVNGSSTKKLRYIDNSTSYGVNAAIYLYRNSSNLQRSDKGFVYRLDDKRKIFWIMIMEEDALQILDEKTIVTPHFSKPFEFKYVLQESYHVQNFSTSIHTLGLSKNVESYNRPKVAGELAAEEPNQSRLMKQECKYPRYSVYEEEVYGDNVKYLMVCSPLDSKPLTTEISLSKHPHTVEKISPFEKRFGYKINFKRSGRFQLVEPEGYQIKNVSQNGQVLASKITGSKGSDSWDVETKDYLEFTLVNKSQKSLVRKLVFLNIVLSIVPLTVLYTKARDEIWWSISFVIPIITGIYITKSMAVFTHSLGILPIISLLAALVLKKYSAELLRYAKDLG